MVSRNLLSELIRKSEGIAVILQVETCSHMHYNMKV